MSETFMTVRGRVAQTPEIHVTASGAEMTVIRVGVNPRHFDRQRNEWIEGHTQWYSVMAFGSLGQNIAKSIGKGDPVVVYGRFRTSQWQPENQPRPQLELEIIASSVGHDLRFGRTNYVKVRYDDKGREVRPERDNSTTEASNENHDVSQSGEAEASHEPGASQAIEEDKELASA